MHLEQFYLGCLAHASYLIADEESGVAVVVDPQRDVDAYIQKAQAHGWRIEHVYLTHFHADFLAGHLELRERTGAGMMAGPGGGWTASFGLDPGSSLDADDASPATSRSVVRLPWQRQRGQRHRHGRGRQRGPDRRKRTPTG